MAKGKYEYWLTNDGLLLLAAWARDGLTDEDIAAKIGIVPSTLYEWKKKHSEISESLKKGKEIVDIEVENSLLKRAKGFNYDEKTYERIWNEKLEKYIKVNTKTITKMVVPDTTAQIYWLKNRKPEQWRDKPEINENEKDMQTAREILISVRRAATNEYQDRAIPKTD